MIERNGVLRRRCDVVMDSSSVKRGGVEQVIEIRLTPEEDTAFKKSVRAIKEVVEEVEIQE